MRSDDCIDSDDISPYDDSDGPVTPDEWVRAHGAVVTTAEVTEYRVSVEVPGYHRILCHGESLRDAVMKAAGLYARMQITRIEDEG